MILAKTWRPVYLILMTVGLYLAFAHWAYDDPFITYRYAFNLTHGAGFVYNPGERVLSTTTPFFALLLAGFSPLTTNFQHLANLIGAFSLALGGLFLWDLANTLKTPAAGWSSLLLYPTFVLMVSTLGSETPLYLALGLGALAAYARHQLTWTALFSALAFLARPDGILLPVILAAHYLATWLRQPGGQRQIPWRAIGVFLLVSLPLNLFDWAYFGSPIPATLATKQYQGSMAVSQNFAEGFLPMVADYARHWYYWLEAGLALAGLVYAVRRARGWLLLLSWTALYFAAYTALGISRYFWYYAPLVPGFIALVGLGIHQSGELASGPVQRLWLSRGSFARATRYLAWGGLITLLAANQILGLGRLRRQVDPRAQIYTAIGQWLKQNTPARAQVGVLEIGIIGYYAQRPMIDFAGLLQPQVAAQLNAHSTYDDAALWAVQNYHPDYLVVTENTLPGLEAGYIAPYCRSVESFSGPDYGYSLNIHIYACQNG